MIGQKADGTNHIHQEIRNFINSNVVERVIKNEIQYYVVSPTIEHSHDTTVLLLEKTNHHDVILFIKQPLPLHYHDYYLATYCY
jgi:hypothetical protein